MEVHSLPNLFRREGGYFSPASAAQAPVSKLQALAFYKHVFQHLFKVYLQTKDGTLPHDFLWPHSLSLIPVIEELGGRVEISGMNHFMNLNTPCVFAANHMSSLETLFLPGLIRPFIPLTFVLKQSLLKYPFLGKVLTHLEVIPVKRRSAREDLRLIYEHAPQRIQKGVSIMLFPQSTRSQNFVASDFGSLGAKLANKLNCPLIPVALDTRFWKIGSIVKDLGGLDSRYPVRVSFGKPLDPEMGEKELQKNCITHIANFLK